MTVGVGILVILLILSNSSFMFTKLYCDIVFNFLNLHGIIIFFWKGILFVITFFIVEVVTYSE